ncbi:hypothetical protein [Desulfatiglans anilini]|uniref:hypothetical protein n=1 Tax=Desulfatiglans anilini TaxID=90728 RepID=UPI00040B6A47|nr:hypothetical protein [Desulfatiglans anilini]
MADDKDSREKPPLDFSFDNNHTAYSNLDAADPDAASDILELTDVVERGPGYEEAEAITLSNLDAALRQERALESEETEETPGYHSKGMGGGPRSSGFEGAGADEDLYVFQPESTPAATPQEGRPPDHPMAISEDRIEEIIRRIVGETVERVARETLTTVAEKLIREAIDSLKESLQSEQD